MYGGTVWVMGSTTVIISVGGYRDIPGVEWLGSCGDHQNGDNRMGDGIPGIKAGD